jgi:hypothetical protein
MPFFVRNILIKFIFGSYTLPIQGGPKTPNLNFPESSFTYFPEGSFKIFDVLLPANLPSQFQQVAAYSLQIKPLASRFHMKEERIFVKFSNLIGNIITNLPEQYYTMKSSDSVDFWMYFMKSPLIEWEGEIKQLVTIILTLSPTTAQVECAFSIMSHVLINR